MAGARLQRIKAIFIAASAVPAGPRREELLAMECGQDAELRREVESLLAAKSTEAAVDPQPSTISSPITEGPGTRIGPYKLLQQIGEGGFGLVFMAEQERPLRRRVALKIIKVGMDTRQVVARFEQERQALAMMDHPNIARVLDAGATDTGRPYFVMELVKGIPIAEYCDANQLTTPERLSLFIPVCNAVHHAHQKGIIHRDIKPSNILVTLHDGTPVSKVIDFGIAKATDARLTEKTLFTEHRAMVGTPAYMSPEQAEMSGLDIDTRSDVYSLGVLLYELLTGTTPFNMHDLLAAGINEIQRIIRETDPPKPSTRVSALGDSLGEIAARRKVEPRRFGLLLRGDLDWIVMKCLEKDRTRRYDAASNLADDVQRHLRGNAVVAAPPSALYRVRKFARRYSRQVIVGALVASAMISSASIASWGWANARAANRAITHQMIASENLLRRAAAADVKGKNLTPLVELKIADEQKKPLGTIRIDRTPPGSFDSPIIDTLGPTGRKVQGSEAVVMLGQYALDAIQYWHSAEAELEKANAALVQERDLADARAKTLLRINNELARKYIEVDAIDFDILHVGPLQTEDDDIVGLGYLIGRADKLLVGSSFPVERPFSGSLVQIGTSLEGVEGSLPDGKCIISPVDDYGDDLTAVIVGIRDLFSSARWYDVTLYVSGIVPQPNGDILITGVIETALPPGALIFQNEIVELARAEDRIARAESLFEGSLYASPQWRWQVEMFVPEKWKYQYQRKISYRQITELEHQRDLIFQSIWASVEARREEFKFTELCAIVPAYLATQLNTQKIQETGFFVFPFRPVLVQVGHETASPNGLPLITAVHGVAVDLTFLFKLRTP
jgi:serine/threonine protein kinase